jgi:hypothetical protein
VSPLQSRRSSAGGEDETMLTRTTIRAAVFLALAMTSVSTARADSALALRVGTLGIGAEFDVGIGDSWVVRLGHSAFSRSQTVDDTDAIYDGKLKLGNTSATIDWHPGGKSFFLSAGAVATSNKIDVVGVPNSGRFDIGNGSYTAAQIGSLRGSVEAGNGIAPYAGIGFGHPVDDGGRFTLLFDVGVILTGTPKVGLTAACGATVPQATCAQIQADVQREISELREEVNQLEVWPVINLGFAFRF